jgi:GDPmannose 4,6-dehydratase/GDP-4-dehydro-6-deoxy-D-mannose reductase
MRKFKKCLFTGATGSGASYLIEYIAKKNPNLKIYGLYRSSGYKKILEKIKNVNLLKVDLNNKNKLNKILKLVKPDLIYHFASNPDVRKSFDTPYEIINNNNLITLNLLENLRLMKIKPLIIICSTSEVYGNLQKKYMPIREETRFNPANPYAVSKAFQDLLSQVYCKNYKMKIIITRMFTYMNPRRDNLYQSAFARQIIEIKKKKKKILKHGKLNGVRTFLDTKDACSAYWLTAQKGVIGEVYNIAGKKIISIKELLKALIKLSGVKVKKKLEKNFLRITDINYQVADTKKFRKHTGWREKTDFKFSLKMILDYFDKII